MTGQHTPGPWEAHASPYLKFATVVIADVAHEIRTELSEHDARLIAAAPDLLAALIALTTPPRDAAIATNYANARAAIAKATGSAA